MKTIKYLAVAAAAVILFMGGALVSATRPWAASRPYGGDAEAARIAVDQIDSARLRVEILAEADLAEAARCEAELDALNAAYAAARRVEPALFEASFRVIDAVRTLEKARVARPAATVAVRKSPRAATAVSPRRSYLPLGREIAIMQSIADRAALERGGYVPLGPAIAPFPRP